MLIPLPSLAINSQAEEQSQGTLLLDSTGQFQPDFEVVEEFMKNLPYSSSIEIELPS
jgi:hypothetical protein